jgi:hypothetical protein
MLLVEHRVLDHADQNFFNRAVAEPVDDALDGLGGDPPSRLRRLIDVSAPVHDVADVALFLQPAQHGSNRRFLEPPLQRRAHGLGRDRATGPDQLHHPALEFAEIG